MSDLVRDRLGWRRAKEKRGKEWREEKRREGGKMRGEQREGTREERKDAEWRGDK